MTVRVTGSVGHGVVDDEAALARTRVVAALVLAWVRVLVPRDLDVALLVLVKVISMVDVRVRVCVAIPVLVMVLVTTAV